MNQTRHERPTLDLKLPRVTRRRVRPILDALFITGGYTLTALLWTLRSDRALRALVRDSQRRARLAEVKEFLFVGFTSTVLFGVTNRYLTRLRRSEDRFVLAQAELRKKDLAVRQGYVDVLDAVTGGKLILITEDELAEALGTTIVHLSAPVGAHGLAAARATVSEAISDFGVSDSSALVLAFSEALTNAVKHGGGGQYAVYRERDCLQILVRDEGPGIDFRTLPKATLIQGFSTTSTMGLGFTIMLEVCDRVLLTTGNNGTVVVLEAGVGVATGRREERQLSTIIGCGV